MPVVEKLLSNEKKAQPVTARMITTAVNGPISLTRPVVSLPNDFLPSGKASQAKKVLISRLFSDVGRPHT